MARELREAVASGRPPVWEVERLTPEFRAWVEAEGLPKSTGVLRYQPPGVAVTWYIADVHLWLQGRPRDEWLIGERIPVASDG